MSRTSFILFTLFFTASIFYLAATTPISPHEAQHYFSDNGIVGLLMRGGQRLIGEDSVGPFFGIRIYFLLCGLLSILLYYLLAKISLQREDDRFLATAIFMLLPGMITALVLANISILVIPIVLMFVLAYHSAWVWLQIFLMIALYFLHDASIIFYIAIFLYALMHKEKILIVLSGLFVLFCVVTLQGVEIGGRPSGHFADLFGVYAALFSPLIFIYFFYTLYRIFLREEKNILWYISFVALLASLILSIRQRIFITDFAPYVVISVVLMLDTYNKSLRIRLPEFRKWYRLGFFAAMTTLVLSSFVILFHEIIFQVMVHPQKHFAYKLYEPYWLAVKLQNEGKECHNIKDDRIAIQLRFYGIKHCVD
jgi:hypothetical protein